jgi:uncharacterized protein YbjT (DUF2867 family)
LKIVIPGGTGQVGTLLDRALTAQGHEVVRLTRSPNRSLAAAADLTSRRRQACGDVRRHRLTCSAPEARP